VIRIPARYGSVGKLPPEPCVDEQGNVGTRTPEGDCIFITDGVDTPLACPSDFMLCGDSCFHCGPNATLNLNDCGCDCLPGHVPVNMDIPGAGCVKYTDEMPVFWDGTAPGGRPPSGKAAPVAAGTKPGTSPLVTEPPADDGPSAGKVVLIVGAGLGLAWLATKAVAR
jgi:hypothetical protein